MASRRQRAVGQRGSIAIVERFIRTLKESTRALTVVPLQRRSAKEGRPELSRASTPGADLVGCQGFFRWPGGVGHLQEKMPGALDCRPAGRRWTNWTRCRWNLGSQGRATGHATARSSIILVRKTRPCGSCRPACPSEVCLAWGCAWRAGVIDVMLLDLHLPDVSGVDFCQRIQEVHDKLPVVRVHGPG
jgi:hypothetical protein